MGGFHLMTLARIPVWISPWFFLIPAFTVLNWGVKQGLALTGCIAISVLAHEFGHAFVAGRFGLGPQIMLHGFGGFTGHQRARTMAQDALIIAAGPLSGALLGLTSLLMLPPNLRTGDALLAAYATGGGAPSGPLWISMLSELALLNLVWSAFNALPMYPLDGGRLFRLAMIKSFKSQKNAERATHVMGLVWVLGLAALLLTVPGLVSLPMAMVLLALMGLRNLQGLTMTPVAVARSEHPRARELLTRAETAYRAGEHETAARLCHQLRAEQNVPQTLLSRCSGLLGVMATQKGEFEEALTLLRGASDASDVVEATAQCFYQLQMYEALDALTHTKAFGKLPNETREQILFALRDELPLT